MPGMSPTRGRLEFLLANDDHGCRCWKVYGCSGDFVLEKRREEKFASQEECSSDGLCWSDGGVFLIWAGDVLSGTSSNGVHHAGIIEESFGFHWWNERVPILVLTIVLILAPLVSFKRVGAIAAVCIGFIFPASIPLRDPHGIATRKDVFIALLMIFLAVVSSSIAIVSDINSLFNKKEEGPP